MASPSSAPTSLVAPGDTGSTRHRLVEAALVEFAAHGYDGASTRAIAERAGVHQPLINYHFSSKESLWRTSVGLLFDELAAAMAPVLAVDGGGGGQDDGPRDDRQQRPGVAGDEALLCGLVDVLVTFAARRPELNRIMVAEATADSDRLVWIAATYTSGAFALFGGLWERLRAGGVVVDLDPMVAYYVVVGASSLLYANAPEARRLTGREPTAPEVVSAHAESLCRMLRCRAHDHDTAISSPFPTEAQT